MLAAAGKEHLLLGLQLKAIALTAFCHMLRHHYRCIADMIKVFIIATEADWRISWLIMINQSV